MPSHWVVYQGRAFKHNRPTLEYISKCYCSQAPKKLTLLFIVFTRPPRLGHEGGPQFLEAMHPGSFYPPGKEVDMALVADCNAWDLRIMLAKYGTDMLPCTFGYQLTNWTHVEIPYVFRK